MAVGKPGERMGGAVVESDVDGKAEAKMANFFVCFNLCSSSISSWLTKQLLKRILTFGNSLDWFLMGTCILTAIGAGAVRSSAWTFSRHIH